MPSWENTEPTPRPCAHCGETFLAKRKNAKYCKDICASRSRPRRTQTTEYRQQVYERIKADPKRSERLRETDRTRQRALKIWINAYKLAAGCIDCGYAEHAVALDFDHMNGKTRNIANLKSISAVEAEIARHDCVVRCANCHRVKSWQTKSWQRSE